MQLCYAQTEEDAAGSDGRLEAEDAAAIFWERRNSTKSMNYKIQTQTNISILAPSLATQMCAEAGVSEKPFR